MPDLIEQRRDQLAELCRRFGVHRLELFGSAASGEAFDPSRSDLDFLVEFLPHQGLGPWLKHYFALQEALERMLGRHVDLVMTRALKNPYFVREVNRTRTTIYAA